MDNEENQKSFKLISFKPLESIYHDIYPLYDVRSPGENKRLAYTALACELQALGFIE